MQPVIATGTTNLSLVNNRVDIAGILFRQTPIGLIQERPTTNSDVLRLNALARGYTQGQMAIDSWTREYIVTSWGRAGLYSERPRFPVEISKSRVESHAAITYRHTDVADLIPAGAMLVTDPAFANRPAVDLSWYHGAGLAALINDIQNEFTVRQISDKIYLRAVSCNVAVADDHDILAAEKGHFLAIAHMDAEESADVVGVDADRRANNWGLVDLYGNVNIWTTSKFYPGLYPDNPEGTIDHQIFTLRGACYEDPRNISWSKKGMAPTVRLSAGGVRFMAELRTP